MKLSALMLLVLHFASAKMRGQSNDYKAEARRMLPSSSSTTSNRALKDRMGGYSGGSMDGGGGDGSSCPDTSVSENPYTMACCFTHHGLLD
jgi:hypothetical protein